MKKNETKNINIDTQSNNIVMQDKVGVFTDSNILNNKENNIKNNKLVIEIPDIYEINNTTANISDSNSIDVVKEFIDFSSVDNKHEGKIIYNEDESFGTNVQEINKNRPWRKCIRRRIADG